MKRLKKKKEKKTRGLTVKSLSLRLEKENILAKVYFFSIRYMQEEFKNKYNIYADRPECAEQIKKINKMFADKDLVHISDEISKLDDIIRRTEKEPEKKIVEVEIEEEYPLPPKSKKSASVVTGGEDPRNYYFIFIFLALIFIIYNAGWISFSTKKKDYNVFINI